MQFMCTDCGERVVVGERVCGCARANGGSYDGLPAYTDAGFPTPSFSNLLEGQSLEKLRESFQETIRRLKF